MIDFSPTRLVSDFDFRILSPLLDVWVLGAGGFAFEVSCLCPIFVLSEFLLWSG